MGSTSSTVQKADPWAPAQPYILEGLDAAQSMWNSDPNQFVIQPWQGDAVADMSNSTRGALSGFEQARIEQRGNLVNNQGALTGLRDDGLNNNLPQPVSEAIDGAVNFTNDPQFNHQVSKMATATSGPEFNHEVNQARTLGRDGFMHAGIYNAYHAGPNATFNNVIGQQANAGGPASLDAAVAGGFMGEDPRLSMGVNHNLVASNDPRFDGVINNITGDGYTDDLRDSLRQNVMESVMPGVNDTFAGSGMTGSSLHQAHLTKALASGMAPVEASFINRANDRALAAAGMSQDAFNDALNRRLDAGQVAHGAAMDRAGMGLDAGALGLQGYNAVNDTRFRAAEAGQRETNLTADRRLEAGQAAADDSYRRAALGLEAGNLMNQSDLSFLDRNFAAGEAANAADLAAANLGLQGGDMAYDAYNANQNRALSAIGMAPDLSAATYNPLQQQFEAGQYRDSLAQNELAAEIMAHQQEQAGPIDAINNYLALTSGLGGQFGTSTATTQQNPGLLGILGGIAPLFSLFSDRRLKEDVEKVGKMDDGTPIHVYRYKGDPVMHMGVMAQDVEKKHPEAVTTHPSGYKMVNYGALA